MINIEDEVFMQVKTAVQAQYPNMFVAGENVFAPPGFPAVVLVEDDNSTYIQTLDSNQEEHHAQVMYTCNVYSNLTSGKKTQCKNILAIVDTEMFNMGFIRVGSSPMTVPNMDSTIYRMVARYRAVVSKEKLVYRR